MALKPLQAEIETLRMKIERLSRELAHLRKSASGGAVSVERLLRTRGIRIFREAADRHLFFPPGLSKVFQDRFYDLMKRYSFRLVARDMIGRNERFSVDDLTRYVSQRVARRYCDDLESMGLIVRERDGTYRTGIVPIHSFGPTLEWFVAELFQRELASPALYGVKLRGILAGGDYDVIAAWNGRLVYVEAKSSPPRGIESSEIAAFFSRIDALLPEVAVLFNDTRLRMKDKLVVLFEEELERRHGKASRELYPVERLRDELFHVRDRVFLVNSQKGVAESFVFCLMHYLRKAQGPGKDAATIKEEVRNS
jgi:hypothetical protein